MSRDPYCRLPQPLDPKRSSASFDDGSLPSSSVVGDWSEVDVLDSPEQVQEFASMCLSTLVCTYCDVCQLMCPDLCITRDAQGQIVIDYDHCKGCGLCAHFCPKEALKMEVESSSSQS